MNYVNSVHLTCHSEGKIPSYPMIYEMDVTSHLSRHREDNISVIRLDCEISNTHMVVPCRLRDTSLKPDNISLIPFYTDQPIFWDETYGLISTPSPYVNFFLGDSIC